MENRASWFRQVPVDTPPPPRSMEREEARFTPTQHPGGCRTEGKETRNERGEPGVELLNDEPDVEPTHVGDQGVN